MGSTSESLPAASGRSLAGVASPLRAAAESCGGAATEFAAFRRNGGFMSRARFLADHDLNQRIIDGTLRREPTIEFIRARDVMLHDRSDPEVLEYAALHGFLVVSHDVNTMPGHAF